MEALITAPVLAHYDPERETAISADASSYGLGAVLLQLQDVSWRPITYCSRRLSNAVTRYTQIEKGMLSQSMGLREISKVPGRHGQI